MAQKNTVTVTPVLLDWAWKENGTNYYRLRITYKRKSKFLKTEILVHRSDLNEDGQPKERAVVYKLADVVRKIEKKVECMQLDTLENEDKTIDDVMSFLNNSDDDGRFRLDFFEFADTIIEAKQGQPRKVYRCAVNSLKTYVDKEKMDISEITSSFMHGWEAWLKEKYGNNARSVSAYTACISFLHGQARLKYNNEETELININNPFMYYKPPRQKVAKHRNIDATLIQQMIDLRPTLTGREKLGVDVFLISFGLMGMNSPDLYTCKAPENNIITYNRTKTRDRRDDEAEMQVKILKAIKPIVDEYHGKDGLTFDFNKRYTTYQIFGANVNAGLRAFASRVGYNGKLTLYSARHSWATIAYEQGVTKGVINDCLCHVDRDVKVTDIYIKKDWSVLWKANEKVLSSFNWAA